MVRPQLDYCAHFWSSQLRVELKKLGRIEQAATTAVGHRQYDQQGEVSDIGLDYPSKGKAERQLTEICYYLKGGYKTEGAKWC